MEPVYSSLDALQVELEAMGAYPAGYWDKMMHRVPVVPVVDRVPWLLARLAGQTILHIGCAGPLHGALQKACTRAYGLDREPTRYPDCLALDIERMRCPLPRYDGVETVVLGEVLEHLLAPGTLLERVREVYQCPVIITTPNAGSAALQGTLRRGIECVNLEHTCWFSWRTLTTLVERCGYTVQEWYWYNGRPLTAEGLIFVVH